MSIGWETGSRAWARMFGLLEQAWEQRGGGCVVVVVVVVAA